MGELLIKENEKKIVVPGEILATGMDYLPASGAFREDDKIISSLLGIASTNGRLVKVVPLNGPYVPKLGDTVIGRIADVNYSNWFVDIGYAYDASLTMKEATSEFIPRGADISEIFALNDLLVLKITNVTRSKAIDVSLRGPGLRGLRGGKVVNVMATKVPRIVGKQGSMIGMIKDMTGCDIVAGQNGRIWISGQDPESEKLATDAVRLIEDESHVSGLTDRVKAFMEKARGEKK